MLVSIGQSFDWQPTGFNRGPPRPLLSNDTVLPTLNPAAALSAQVQLAHSVLTAYGRSYHYFTAEVRVQQAFDYQMAYLCEPSMERLFSVARKEKANVNHTAVLQNALFLSSSRCCGNYLRVSRSTVGTSTPYSVCA